MALVTVAEFGIDEGDLNVDRQLLLDTDNNQLVLWDVFQKIELNRYGNPNGTNNPPEIIAPTDSEVVTFTKNIPSTYQAIAENDPAAWQLSPDVDGISIDSTGLITYDGTGTVGSYNVEITASNLGGESDPVDFVIKIEEGIPDNSEILLDGSSFNDESDGTLIDLWPDLSGNNNDFEAPTIVSKPTLNKDSFGSGNHALSFNGSTSYLECVNLTSDIFGLAPNQGEVWIVFRQNGKSGIGNMLFDAARKNNGNTNASFLSLAIDTNFSSSGGISNNTNYLAGRGRQSTGANYALAENDNEISDVTDYYLSLIFGSGDLEVFKNGVSVDSNTYATPSYDGSSGNSPVNIGKRANASSNFASVDIAFLVVYARTLSNDERTALNTYISNRFGIL